MTKTGFDNCFTHPRIGFIVSARHAAVLTEPAEAALHDPTSGQHHEALGTERLADHFHAQAHRRSSRGHQRPLVAGVSPEKLQVRRVGPGFGQHRRSPNRVLDTGCLHQHGQRQAQRVDGDMPLTASYLLARVVAVTAPLLPPVRTDCESIAPAVGSGARVS